MPTGRVWMYNPYSGGRKIPEHVRRSTAERIEAFAAEHLRREEAFDLSAGAYLT